MVLFSAGNLLVYCVNAGNRHADTQESFEGGRVGLDFLLNQSRLANEIRLTNYKNTDVLKRMDLVTETNEGEHVYIFAFDRAAKRLEFGGSKDYPFTSGVNELASGIERVLASYDEEKGVLYFSVAVLLNGGETLFNGGVDARYKTVSIR